MCKEADNRPVNLDEPGDPQGHPLCMEDEPEELKRDEKE